MHLPPKAPGGLKLPRRAVEVLPAAMSLHLPPKAPGGLKRVVGAGVDAYGAGLALAPEGARGIETAKAEL